MNKKVDEDFVGIKDVYALQCLATELKEENEEYRSLIEMENQREYRSKFLKDFQKEKGKNVFPDYDEIYKRYDDYKTRIDKAIEYIEECYTQPPNIENFMHEGEMNYLLDILKGGDKDE